MPQAPDALLQRLATGGPPPVCLIAGEEPYLQREAQDAYRAAAREAGFTEREVFDVESGFDWGELEQAAASMSLFGDRRLLEVRMPGGRPGKDGGAALSAYAERPPEDTLLLVSCERLDRSARQSAWAKALEGAGMFVYCWPIPARELPAWVAARLRTAGLRAGDGVAERVAERAEGNLLAADQAVEKLRLLAGDDGAVDVDLVADALADSARFAADDLCDAALQGQVARALRILAALKAEGVQPPLVVWALARDVRAAARLAAGEGDEALNEERIWRQRAGRLKAVSRRAPAPVWHQLLRRCHRADRAVKGLWPGRPWEELRLVIGRIARIGQGGLSREGGGVR